MSYSSLRLMLSLGCASNMRLDIADVKLAYVQSFLDRTLYMSMLSPCPSISKTLPRRFA